jgi:hypothetical protein
VRPLMFNKDLEETLQHLVMRLSRRAPSRCMRPMARSEKVNEPNGSAVCGAEVENAVRVTVDASRVLRGRLVPMLDY